MRSAVREWEDAMAGVRELPNQTPGRFDRVSLGLGISAFTAFLVLCAVLGARREAYEQLTSRWRNARVRLAYGENLPTFHLATSSGRWLESRELKGRWALL